MAYEEFERTKFRRYKGRLEPKRKRDFSLRRPTASQERKRKKKSACSVRNDGGGREARKNPPAAFDPVTASGMQKPQMTEREGRGRIEIKPRRAFSAADSSESRA